MATTINEISIKYFLNSIKYFCLPSMSEKHEPSWRDSRFISELLDWHNLLRARWVVLSAAAAQYLPWLRQARGDAAAAGHGAVQGGTELGQLPRSHQRVPLPEPQGGKHKAQLRLLIDVIAVLKHAFIMAFLWVILDKRYLMFFSLYVIKNVDINITSTVRTCCCGLCPSSLHPPWPRRAQTWRADTWPPTGTGMAR